MKIHLIIILLLLNFSALFAQQIKVTGVVSSNDEELIGVTVKVKETNQGTVTNIDGKYEIMAMPDATLIFSYLGYETVEVQVKEQTTINVKMKDAGYALKDVEIVVPYGVAKKSTFTGSAGVIDSKVIEQSQVASVSKALQGTVAGVQTFSSTGQPGSDAAIRIRGVGSINASNEPLFVVDGVPYDGNLSSIASSDIESITILKDAASATLYGSRAGNGVVMITTKHGKQGSAPVLELNAKMGFSSRAMRDYDQLSTNDYWELYWEAARNSRYDNTLSAGLKEGKTETEILSAANQYVTERIVSEIGINPYGAGNKYPIGTDGKLVAGLTPLWNADWEDALSQTAHYNDISLKISGGGQKSSYYISGSFLDDQGYVLQSGFKRYTVRTNIVTEVKPWLEVGLNLSGTHSIQNYPKQDDSAISNVIGFARGIPSFYPIYVQDLEKGGLLNGEKVYDFGSYRATSYAGYNLVATLPLDLSKRSRDAATMRTYALFKPMEGLTVKTSLNLDYNSRFNHNYVNGKYGKTAETGGSVSKYNSRTASYTINNVATYNFNITPQQQLQLLAGQEYYQYNTSDFGGEKSNMMVGLGYTEPDMASILNSFEGYSDEYKLLSFFGSANYSLQDKYYLSSSLRTDGSSRFSPDSRWGTFWSVGGSWRIAQEPFMKSLVDSGLTNLLLKSSYGAQGNDNIGNYYAYKQLLTASNNMGNTGLASLTLSNQDLKWETNLNFNIGVDFGFFNNRLTGEIEYFNRRSKDLLMDKDLVPSIGYSSILDNIGKIKNYGWEFTITGYPIHTQNWKWRLSVNATTYKNKITDLPNKEIWSGSKKWIVGGSIYDFYMPEWAGVNPENGNPMWYRYKDGEKITTDDYSSITDNDKVKVGNSLPIWSGGIQSDLTFKDFSLSTVFSYVIGGKIYNGDKISLLSQGSPGKTWSVDMLDRWTPENRYTDVPRLTTSPSSSWTQQSSRFLVNRSFLRLKTLSLSYNVPNNFLKSIYIKDASVFVQAENLFTLHKQQGLDPEQNFEGTTYYRYPSMKTISFGFNVKL